MDEKPVGGTKTDCPRCGGCGYIEFDFCGNLEYAACGDCAPSVEIEAS